MCLQEPVYTADGFELSIGTNHLGHFLLVHLLMDKLKEAPNKDPRWGTGGHVVHADASAGRGGFHPTNWLLEGSHTVTASLCTLGFLA